MEAKNKYKAVVLTVYGGTGFKRAKTIEEAKEKAIKQANESEALGFPVSRSYITDNFGKLIHEFIK